MKVIFAIAFIAACAIGGYSLGGVQSNKACKGDKFDALIVNCQEPFQARWNALQSICTTDADCMRYEPLAEGLERLAHDKRQ